MSTELAYFDLLSESYEMLKMQRTPYKTLVRVLLKIDAFDGQSRLYTWLTSRLTNCCLVELGKNKEISLIFPDGDEDGHHTWSDLLSGNAPALDDALIVDEQVSGASRCRVWFAD